TPATSGRSPRTGTPPSWPRSPTPPTSVCAGATAWPPSPPCPTTRSSSSRSLSGPQRPLVGGGLDEAAEALVVGRVGHAELGDDGRHQGGRGHVEGPVEGGDAGRGQRRPTHPADLVGGALLDRDRRPVGGGQGERRAGGGHADGHAV